MMASSGTSVPHHKTQTHSSAQSPFSSAFIYPIHIVASSVTYIEITKKFKVLLIAFCQTMVLKTTLVYLYSDHRQFSLGRTITVKFNGGGKVIMEKVLNDSVMNLPTDSCQLAGVLAKPFNMMDRTSTDEAFALLQLENGC